MTRGSLVWPGTLTRWTLVNAAVMDQHDLCIAYLIDIEARAVRFQHDFPDVRVHEVRLEALNEPGGVDALFGSLAVEPTRRTTGLIGSVVNQRAKRKSHFANPTSIE